MLRNLVTGADSCAGGGGGGESTMANNPLGRLADAVLGAGSRGKEAARGLPGYLEGVGLRRVEGRGMVDEAGPSTSAFDAGHSSSHMDYVGGAARGFTDADVDAFLREARTGGPEQGFEEAFQGAEAQYRDPLYQGLRTFLRGAAPQSIGGLDLSVEEKCRIRDRAGILARHLWADPTAADVRVVDFLHSLNIRPGELPLEAPVQGVLEFAWQSMTEPHAALDYALAERRLAGAGPASGGLWAEEFDGRDMTSTWAGQFAAQDEVGGAQGLEVAQEGGAKAAALIMESMRHSDDPKLRNSKFISFLSKMTQGQNPDPGPRLVEDAWARDFEKQYDRVDLAAFEAPFDDPLVAKWANEFQESGRIGLEDITDVHERWADELARSTSERASVGASGYAFASPNPYLGVRDAMKLGQDLFSRGMLLEAALAVEADLQESPRNLAGWKLLGTIHAENDDDKKAISAMKEALKVHPDDPEVCLSLGVSYTNELEVEDAVGYLRSWLSGHSKYQAMASAMGEPLDKSQQLRHLIGVINSVSLVHDQDPDLFVSLGVLSNLDRDYTRAIQCFERALELGRSDYSLLNKIGATLANSGRSSDAIGYYQRALDIKPNYVRAWVNLAISYGNLGEYDQAARYYIRALQMNGNNEQVWSYLRTVLICMGRVDCLEAIDSSTGRDIASLSALFGG